MSAAGVLPAIALAGLVVTSGAMRSPDMVSAQYSPDIPAPAHLGHWDTPRAGDIKAISVQVLEAGTGAGTVRFFVVHEGVGELCSASAPCTSDSLYFGQENCADNDIPAGARIHLQWEHTCTTPPSGHAVFVFEWAR